MNQLPIMLISPEERDLRLRAVRRQMRRLGINAMIISDNANLFYLTGRVFTGYAMIWADAAQPPMYFVRRPVGLSGEGVVYIRKPEEIPAHIPGIASGETIGVEMDCMSYSDCCRLTSIFPQVKAVNADAVMRQARAVKTPDQIRLARISGEKQTEAYSVIPSLFTPGMTDVDFQIAIESTLRRHGCLGIFRISGQSMEIFMGNVLAGDNADCPTPYDFAMGGGGQHPSLPVGADGTVIRPGMSVMVDCNGNFTGYMTDMTRVFSCGTLPQLAIDALECSREICRRLADMGREGVEAKALYNEAVEIAREAGLEEYFMGHSQKAGFTGHGVGIEINELPVIAPRSRDILTAGNIIALEPKFVIPGTGAVGIENTYVVRPDGLPMECITNAPEEIISLD